MQEKLGIKELKEVVMFGFSVYKAADDVFKGGFDGSKILGHIFPLYNAAIPAFQNIKDVPQELSDISAEEISELVAMMVAQGAPNEKVMEIIEKSLFCAVSVYNLVQVIKK